MNGGEIIAHVLHKQGVKYLFTLCGGHISPIFVAAQNAGIRVIDTRHEVNAVFAADAVSRLTGIPGVAAVTAGPGVTNTITAVRNARLAQSPLVLLGGAAATLLKGRGALQDIDQMALMQPNVKWAVTIKRVREIAPTLQRAFAIAQEGVPGPVFVECPIDTLYDEALVRSWFAGKNKEPHSLGEKLLRSHVNRHLARLFESKDSTGFDDGLRKVRFPRHSDSHIAQTISLLKSATKPVLLIGSGALMNPSKAGQLQSAIAKLGIPVFLSGMGRGLLGKNNELQMRHHRKEAMKDSDLIILAGVANDFRLDYGDHIGRRPFIAINRSHEDLVKNKKPSLPIHADPQDFLVSLSHNFNGEYPGWMEHLRQRDAGRETHIDAQAKATTATGINPIQLFRALDRELEEKTILIADGGDFVATSSYILCPRKPLSWLDPGVFGTLGVGAGFALGAKLVHPDHDVWIIYGDGSAAYSLLEYDTFVRHKLPVISIIGNDACWSQIARDQIPLLKSDCAMNLAFSNYEQVGKAFGAQGVRVENMEIFMGAIQEAKRLSRSGTPYLINAIIGKTDFRKGSVSM
jgi:thiamine pyrophosphate-dependent acetolactate synthase large subunit-like protein